MALVELAKFYNSFESGVVRSALEAEGIDSFLFDLDMTAAGFGFEIRLMVDEDDLEAARRVMGAAEDRR